MTTYEVLVRAKGELILLPLVPVETLQGYGLGTRDINYFRRKSKERITFKIHHKGSGAKIDKARRSLAALYHDYGTVEITEVE